MRNLCHACAQTPSSLCPHNIKEKNKQEQHQLIKVYYYPQNCRLSCDNHLRRTVCLNRTAARHWIFHTITVRYILTINRYRDRFRTMIQLVDVRRKSICYEYYKHNSGYYTSSVPSHIGWYSVAQKLFYRGVRFGKLMFYLHLPLARETSIPYNM